MGKSNSIVKETAIIYARLSRDDDLDGESYSISNQKKLLTSVAKEKGYTKLLYFFDDGISGVTMNREQFNRAIEAIKMKKASAFFVKDLSRLGRNYIEVGKLTEEFFPEHNIRFVSVSDGIDSEEGECEFAPIKNLFNEWYSRDISKKRRISNKIKGGSGIPLGQPPYGYMKDPDNIGKWLIDEEPANVVHWIDSMLFEGKGTMQIATILTEHKILTPAEYSYSKGRRKPAKNRVVPPYKWSTSSVRNILTAREYCGDIVNFKTYTKSYKNKKRYQNSIEDMKIFLNVNKPIRSREDYEKILKILDKKCRKKPTNGGNTSIFSGLLVCHDCGSNLHYHFNRRNPEIKYFNCSSYNKGKLKKCDTPHYIREDFLEQIVLSEVRRLTRFAMIYEDAFTTAIADYSKKVAETEQNLRQGEIKALISRDTELDVIFEKLYEDNVSGKITDERFKKLSQKYEDEQQSISQRIEQLKEKFDEIDCKISQTQSFVDAVKKYLRIRKLNSRIISELIEKIEVFNSEIVNGVRTQKVIIHYNCVGSIEIPDNLDLPKPQISLNTRKGVTINYIENSVAV